MNIPQNTIWLELHFTLWHVWAALDDDNSAKESRPPEATNGSIPIYDKEKVKEFINIKKRAHAWCARMGQKWNGGYFIDKNNLPKVEAELSTMRNDWNLELNHLLREYPSESAVWAASKGTQWEAMYRDKQPDASDLSGKYNFSWSTLEIIPVSTQSVYNDTLQTLAPLSDEAKDSVYVSVVKLWYDSFKGKDKPSHKAWGALRDRMESAQAKAFINPELGQLADVLQEVLDNDLYNQNAAACLMRDGVFRALEYDWATALDSFAKTGTLLLRYPLDVKAGLEMYEEGTITWDELCARCEKDSDELQDFKAAQVQPHEPEQQPQPATDMLLQEAEALASMPTSDEVLDSLLF